MFVLVSVVAFVSFRGMMMSRLPILVLTFLALVCHSAAFCPPGAFATRTPKTTTTMVSRLSESTADSNAESKKQVEANLKTKLETKIDNAETELKSEFDKVDARFDKVETKIDKVGTKIDNMKTELKICIVALACLVVAPHVPAILTFLI